MRDMIFAGIARERRAATICEAIKAFVVSYYDNYTDATSIEPEVIAALSLVLTETGDPIDDDLGDLIAEAEREINQAGGIVGSDGVRHKVGKEAG